jgi:hypothetical protein
VSGTYNGSGNSLASFHSLSSLFPISLFFKQIPPWTIVGTSYAAFLSLYERVAHFLSSVDFGRLDPDPGGQKDQQLEKS